MHELGESVYPVLLAGGTGTRLWPVSRELFPKQLVRFIGEESLVQSTIKRLAPVFDADSLRIVCGTQHVHEIARHMEEIGWRPEGKILPEPCGRNTAPAILLSVLDILANDGEAVLCIFPADHVIGNVEAFHQSVVSAVELARLGYVVTFGMRPHYPETGYGYIEGADAVNEKARHIRRFVEKPDRETAEKYLKTGDFFWNSGMFVFQASVILDEFKRHQPELLRKMEEMLAAGDPPSRQAYEELPAISIDYAVMEKTEKGVVLPADFGWSDIGSWKSLYDFLPKDKDNNVIDGDVITKNTRNSLIIGRDRLIATNGLDNAAIIETPDSVFVSALNSSRDVKTIVSELKEKGREEYYRHRTVYHDRGGTTARAERNGMGAMQVPLLDLRAQYQTIKAEILDAVEKVFESQHFILGAPVEELEKEIAEYCRTKHAIGVSSGTDALLISLMAAGVGSGDCVLTTPYTFFATAGSIARLEARPIFADIDPDTYNISSEGITSAIAGMSGEERARLKAIIPVHLYGQCADMDPVLQIAEQQDLVVIEDAAQAIGATHDGRFAGSMGSFGCFSFFPTKNLGAFGDGGIVTTNADELFDRLRVLRVHGSQPKYYHKMIGGNFRLDSLQAAIVSVKLNHLDNWTAGRQENARRYRELFKDMGLADLIGLPVEKGSRHIYNQFIIALPERRDALRLFLQEAGIGTEIYYPVPMHLQECFSYLNYAKGDFPCAEHAALHTLALPIYPELSEDQQVYVVEKIRGFYAGTG